MIRVELTKEQEIEAAVVGFRRRKNAVLNGLTPRHRAASLWGCDAEGAMAELAASIATGLPWTGRDFIFRPGLEVPPDIGEKTEVRWVAPAARAEYGHTLNLDVRRDHDDSYYLLVAGFAPVYSVIGYILGADGRRTQWVKVYPEREVYRVPESALTPLMPGEASALR